MSSDWKGAKKLSSGTNNQSHHTHSHKKSNIHEYLSKPFVWALTQVLIHLHKHVPKSTCHLNSEVHLNRGVKWQELLLWKHTEESECFGSDTLAPRTLLHIPWGNTDFQTGNCHPFRLGLDHTEVQQTWSKSDLHIPHFACWFWKPIKT